MSWAGDDTGHSRITIGVFILAIIIVLGVTVNYFYGLANAPNYNNSKGERIGSIILIPSAVNTTDTNPFNDTVTNSNSFTIVVSPEFSCTCRFTVNVELYPVIGNNTWGPNTNILQANQQANIKAVGTWLSGPIGDGIHINFIAVRQT